MSRRFSDSTTVVLLWWAVWILLSVYSWYVARTEWRVYAREPAMRELFELNLANIVIELGGMVEAVLMIILVRGITRRQEVKAARKESTVFGLTTA